MKEMKDGYGRYEWADGRKFEGWWHRGKQHGLGIVIESGYTPKYGLWEHGKRRKWFKQTKVVLIN